ncbi:MAG: class I SAM-dependent methyltransferase [Dehalococcoidia bacterium]|nr:MAG: class I SAM-dependent methyltransferase [Dehalococcoidia bacterium]
MVKKSDFGRILPYCSYVLLEKYFELVVRKTLKLSEFVLTDFLTEFKSIATPSTIDYFNVHYNRFIETLDLLLQYVPQKRKVLDIGCFPGYVTVAAGLLGYNVYGVDIEPSALARFTQKFGTKFIKANIENKKLPFNDQEFDCVIFTELIEHINPFSVGKVLSEIFRVLKNDGYLLMSTPNFSTLENRLFLSFGREIIPWGHAREYTLNEVVNLLLPYFQVVDSYYSMVRDILTIKSVHGMDKPVREHVLKGFIKYRHWKNIGRVLAYPLKKLCPSLRSTIFIVARKGEAQTVEDATRSLSSYRGFGD